MVLVDVQDTWASEGEKATGFGHHVRHHVRRGQHLAAYGQAVLNIEFSGRKHISKQLQSVHGIIVVPKN